MPFGVADDFAHVCVVVVGQVGSFRSQYRDDTPAGGVPGRLGTTTFLTDTFRFRLLFDARTLRLAVPVPEVTVSPLVKSSWLMRSSIRAGRDPVHPAAGRFGRGGKYPSS